MVKKNELQKIDKKTQEVSKYDFIICPNCGAEEVGKFCPNCGQSNKDFNKPIKEIFGDLLDSINLDIRLINSVAPFFTKPGFLTEEYFKGKRKKYVPPMRMYILFSVLFFFLAQFANLDELRGLGKVSDDSVPDSLMKDIAVPNAEMTNIVGAYMQQDSLIDANKSSSKGPEIINVNEVDTSQERTFNELTEEEKIELIEELESDTTMSEGIKEITVGALKITEKMDVFWGKFLNNISYVLFLLMPFFALILAMTLWKSKKMYVHHLVFSINFHSFIFAYSSILILLGMILPEKFYEYTGAALLIFPLYLMFGIKRFYNKTYVKSFFKSIGILFLYVLIIFIVLLIIFLITAKGLYEM